MFLNLRNMPLQSRMATLIQTPIFYKKPKKMFTGNVDSGK